MFGERLVLEFMRRAKTGMGLAHHLFNTNRAPQSTAVPGIICFSNCDNFRDGATSALISVASPRHPIGHSWKLQIIAAVILPICLCLHFE
jgi:hypothetical protein